MFVVNTAAAAHGMSLKTSAGSAFIPHQMPLERRRRPLGLFRRAWKRRRYSPSAERSRRMARRTLRLVSP